MKKIIGLTGGIGSGKSTVALYFEELGVPVYIADDVAKQVLKYPETARKIVQVFGEVSNKDGIDRKKLAQIVFDDPEKLKQLNAIVHPAVHNHFNDWIKLQDANFVIKEAAILFESGSYKDCDKIISVSAATEVRIERVMSRDNVTREQVLQRMQHQLTDNERNKRSDFVIFNEDLILTKLQVSQIFTTLVKLYSIE